MSTERGREDRHNTVKESRLTQERQCATMSLDQLKAELSTLRCLLTKVNSEYEDRRSLHDSLSARIDVVQGVIIEMIDNEQAQGSR